MEVPTKIFILLIFASIIPYSFQDQHRLNYGVIFQKQTDVDFASDVWTHTFEIPLYLDTDIRDVSVCALSNQKYCLVLHQLSVNINIIRSKLKAHLKTTKDLVYSLVPQTTLPLNSRAKRALLPFVGELSKSIFGIATTNDVNVLAQHINRITQRENKIARALQRYGGDFSSFITHVDDRITNAVRGITQNGIAINQIINEIKVVDKQIPTLMSIFSSYLMKHLNNAFMMETFLTNLRSSLSDLAEGKLSPSIVPPNVVTQTIADIQQILDTDNMGYKIIIKDPSYYYKFAKFTMLRNNSMLYLSVRFPLATYANSFTAYKVMSFPVPINNSLNHASQMLNLPDYLLLSKDNKFYTTLSDKTMSQCQITTPVHCFQKPNLLSTNDTTDCLLNLFQGNSQDIKTACNFRFLTNVLKPHMIQITNTDLLVYQTNKITMQCNNSLTEMQGCDFCIINIPCHCTLLTETNKFLPQVASCREGTQNITKLHPVNLALLQHFFHQDTLKEIIANTTFQEAVSIKVPTFKIYKHNMNHILANDKALDLSLKTVIRRTKQDNKIYSNLAEPLLDGEIQLETNWPNMNDILTYIAFGLTIFNTIWLIWLFYKFKTIATALVLTKTASATPIFKFTQPISSTETNTLWDSLLQENVQWDHFTVALLIIVCSLLLFVIKKLITKNNTSTVVCLEITNGKQCLIIKALNLPMCLSHWNIKHPSTIDNLTVTGFIFPKLMVNWPNFAFTSKLTPTSIQVPGLISLSYYQAFILKRMLIQPYCAYVVLAHQNIYYPIKSRSTCKHDNNPTQNQLYPNVF